MPLSAQQMRRSLALTGTEMKPPQAVSWIPLLIVTITGGALVYGTLDMPPYGDPGNPVHLHLAPEYIGDSVRNLEGQSIEVGIQNIVTSVLASYRGYDTLGELTVIFTAGIGVLALLGIRRRKRDES